MIGYLILAFLSGCFVTSVVVFLKNKEPYKELKALRESFERLETAITFAEKNQQKDAVDLSTSEKEFYDKLENLPFEGDK
jgi:hypothetical protein